MTRHACQCQNMKSFIDAGKVTMDFLFSWDNTNQHSQFLLTTFQHAFKEPYTDSDNYYQNAHKMRVEQELGIWKVNREF